MSRLVAAALAASLALILLHPLGIAADPAPHPAHVSLAARMAARRAVSEASRGDRPRGYLLVARETVSHFPPDLQLTFCEIGIAESDGLPDKIGDVQTPFVSVGLFQVRLVHTRLLARLTRSQDRALWVEWLQNPQNNAQAAYLLWRRDGLRDWGSWTDGRARLFQGDAERALREMAN